MTDTLISDSQGVCTVCQRPFQLMQMRDDSLGFKWGKSYSKGTVRPFKARPMAIPVHGPKDSRCPGSHTLPMPWLEARGLPDWEDLSGLDKGAALLHVWKRKREGAGYAIENYPVRYLVSPELIALDTHTACRHASYVTGGYDVISKALGPEEEQRLYNAALEAERASR